MNRILAVVCLGVAIVVSLPLESIAGNLSGSVTAQWLKIPIDARGAAMGSVQVPLAQGALSMSYNPSGILSVEEASFGVSYNQWFADIQHSYFAGVVNLHELGTVGVAVTMLTTGEMDVTTPLAPEGTGEKFKVGEYAYTLTYARQITDMFGLGLSVKNIKSYLYNDDISSSTIAFDIGTLYDIPALKTRLGISVTNLGRDLRYINEQYSIPTALKFGARTTIMEEDGQRLYVAAQIGRPNDADEQYNLGVEYTFQNIVSFRTGYKFNYDTENWSGGIGVSLAELGINGTIDYSYTNYKFLSATHMFSTEIGF
jgi:hypothetical protein